MMIASMAGVLGLDIGAASDRTRVSRLHVRLFPKRIRSTIVDITLDVKRESH